MALDGIFLGYISVELMQKLLGGRIDKIYQPEKDLITMTVRNHNQNFRLLISAHSSYARLHLTEHKFNNPQYPPDFCMLLRKYLIHSYIESIEQPDFERIIFIRLAKRSDNLQINDRYLLVIELMGRHSNIILVNSQDEILDGIKRFRQDEKSLRAIYPGTPYFFPPKQGKVNPLSIDFKEFEQLISGDNNKPLYRTIMNNLKGIGPVSAREIVFRGLKDLQKKGSDLSGQELKQVFEALQDILKPVKNNSLDDFSGEIFFEDGKIKAWSPFPLTYLSGEKISFKTPKNLMDYYYNYKVKVEKIESKKNELSSKVNALLERYNKKLHKLQEKIEEYRNADDYKIMGELLFANLYNIKKGQKIVKLPNYYNENKLLTIELDPSKSPSKNAQKYFKKYNKAKKGQKFVEQEIKKVKMEIAYLESTLININDAENEEELQEIRRELVEEGYLKIRKTKKKNTQSSISKPRKFLSSDGLEILVGRNNRQNDLLVTKIASPMDFWFHVKDLPGSHVLVRNSSRLENLPEKTITEAALLAAFFSKGKLSSNVPVDYTMAKHVKKPKGAKPGLVYYNNYSTIFVTPQEEKINKLKDNN